LVNVIIIYHTDFTSQAFMIQEQNIFCLHVIILYLCKELITKNAHFQKPVTI